jgi:dTDP-4-dehydrorhamnose 3,5-epimerase
MQVNMEGPKIISGGEHTDFRGRLTFFNNFDMSLVKRFYSIENAATNIVRAWRGHRIEQRWFYADHGAFKIKLVKIDDWSNPSPKLFQITFDLEAKDNTVLYIPKGYASSIQALEAHSKLIVFADSDMVNAKNDDYLFPEDYFKL